MNSVEEESTFFISLEKNNIKNQIHNFKNIKSKYFSKPINAFRNNRIKIHKPSSSFSNYQNNNDNILKQNSILSNQTNKNNYTSKIKIMKKYIKNENISRSFLLTNKNDNESKKIKDDLDENIDIEDMDEYYDIKLNININKPKLLIHNKHYYNNNSLNISRNNHFIKTSNINIYFSKANNYHNRCKVGKNKSYSFSNTHISKPKLNENITIMDSKIDMLKTLIKRRNIKILSLKILFEKNNSYIKLKKYKKNLEADIDEIRKEILKLKLKKTKFQDKYVDKKILEKEINKENILFSSKKAQIMEKILDHRIFLLNNIKNNCNSNNNFAEDSTIVNDSFIFDNEYNLMETIENEKKCFNNKNKLINNKNESAKINNSNEVNCFKNKNVSKYFSPRFFIETKSYHKNKYIQ